MLLRMLFLGLFSFKSPTYSILKMTRETLVCWTAGGLLFWWCMTIPWQAAVLSLLQLKDCSKGSSPFVSVKFTDYMHHFCVCAILWALGIVTVTSLPDSSPWSWLGGFCISSRKLECILFHLYHIQLLNILSVQYFLAYWINASYTISPRGVFPSVCSYCIVRWSVKASPFLFWEDSWISSVFGCSTWLLCLVLFFFSFLLGCFLDCLNLCRIFHLPPALLFSPVFCLCDLWTFELN